MKVNIYYGGRGLMDDPTLFVIDKMQAVLEELNVKVERYMLCEQRAAITTLPQTLRMLTVSYSQRLLNGTVSADICSSFWMHAGCMATRKRSQRSICVP